MATSRQRGAPAGGLARAHRIVALGFLAGALVQFFLAGYAAFGGTDWEPHEMWGWVLVAIALVVLVLAAAGRREALAASALLFGLMLVQYALGAVGEDVPILGALHPLNALAILGAAMLSAAGRRPRFGPPH